MGGRGELRGEVGAEGVRRGIGSSVAEALRANAAKGEGAAAHAARAAAGRVDGAGALYRGGGVFGIKRVWN